MHLWVWLEDPKLPLGTVWDFRHCLRQNDNKYHCIWFHVITDCFGHPYILEIVDLTLWTGDLGSILGILWYFFITFGTTGPCLLLHNAIHKLLCIHQYWILQGLLGTKLIVYYWYNALIQCCLTKVGMKWYERPSNSSMKVDSKLLPYQYKEHPVTTSNRQFSWQTSLRIIVGLYSDYLWVEEWHSAIWNLVRFHICFSWL